MGTSGKGQTTAQQEHSPKRFSVIIPVYNAEDTIEQCLAALVAQDYPGELFEIVVIDDGSTDDTRSIASRFPVRVVSLPENSGRLVARQVGAREAKYDLLVFNDARVIPERGLLRKLSSIDHLPVMPDVIDYDGKTMGYSRLFYLMRRKFYHPYYPLFEKASEILIEPRNFHRMPKGTTCIACTKSQWLECQPEQVGKHINDDTRILECIVGKSALLRTSAVKVQYLQRTRLCEVLRHVYGRGPRFAEYYTSRGGRYYWTYVCVWLALASLSIAAICLPKGLLWVLLALGLGSLGLATWLSEQLSDLVVVFALLPPVVVAFGLGVLYGRILCRVRTRTALSHVE